MKCTIQDCKSEAKGRGLCHKHYKRWQTHGDPTIVVNKRIHGMTLKERILDTIKVEGVCWVWTGSVSNKGRPRLKYKCKTTTAHRASYIAFKGKIKDGLYVLHTCDNPMCVNPDHLYAGTHQDNMNDRTNRGRGIKGERHHKAKLTEKEVISIRNSDRTATSMAHEYDIAISTVCRIRRNEIWRDNANQRRGNV